MTAVVALGVLDEDGRIVHRYPLAPGEHLLGTGAEACPALRGAGVSRRHAALEVPDDGGAVVSDLGSKNGTFVDGRRVRRAAVGVGGRLAFGAVEAVLLAADPAADAIAIPPPGARTAGTAADESVTPSDPAGPSTEGVAPVERAVAALRDVARAGGGGRRAPGEAAVALAEAWIACLPLAAVSFLRPEGAEAYGAGAPVVAHAGGDPRTLGEPGLRVVGAVAGERWALDAWPADAARGHRTLERLRPCFELALSWLDGLAVDTGRAPGRAGPAAEPADPPCPGGCARVYREAAKGARGAIPILIRGESGAGKEVLARFVHERSPRAGGPFLAINCAALSSDLLEAELFGIERGVATGVEARPGLLENASGGTLFLDEVGDMPLPLQAKVLRVLEGASFYRVGGREPIAADVRFVAATNVDLEKSVRDGAFRGDLYHRLSAFRVEVPPLRDRPEDVPTLAARFFHGALGERGVASPGITRGALGALVRHSWPGNVRELKNEIARAVLMLEPGEPLDVHHLTERLRGESPPGPPALSLAGALAEAERRAFRTALAAAAGDSGRAMELLDLPRSTYYRRVKELGIG